VDDDGGMRRRTAVAIGAVVLVVLAMAVAAGLWWFFKDDAPPAVDLGTAVEDVESRTATSAAGGSAATGGATTGVEGSWVVDAETGTFDYESASGTFVGFRIQEQLAGIGSTTAVGRTGDVSGSMAISGTTVTEASFEVELATITTNESRRDDQVQRALSTGTFPTATFTLTEPIALGAGAAEGQTVSATAVGQLTIHGVTRTVQLPIEAQLVEGTIVVVGSMDVTFSDHDVEVPRSQVVLSVDDHGTLELQLLLVPA
jgi:polyisoprenoid-binding protein YceI